MLLIFTFWISGGFEEYIQPDIEIVIPEGFTGLVCATSRPGSIENKSEVARYEIQENGLLVVDGDILRSHRKRRYFSKPSEGERLRKLPRDTMFGIYTEGGHTKNISYVVLWVGTRASWTEFKSNQHNNLVCLSRYSQDES